MSEGAAYVPPTDRSTDRVDPPKGKVPGQTAIVSPSAPETTGAPVAPEGLEGLGSQCSQSSEGAGAVSPSTLRLLADALSERDWSILVLTGEHRFLTRNHVTALLFADHTSTSSGERTCRRVLARLTDLRVLEPLERRVGGVRAGSASLIFRVGLRGDLLLRQRRGDSGRARRKEPSLRHLDHCLAIAEARVSLAQAAAAGEFDLLRVATEPTSWRDYLSLGGSRLTLKPDMYVVTANGEFEDLWFLEVDRATESVPVVLRQCQLYQDYRATTPAGSAFPRVVWLVPDAARAAKLTAAIHGARKLGAGLFRVITLAGLLPLIAEGAA